MIEAKTLRILIVTTLALVACVTSAGAVELESSLSNAIQVARSDSKPIMVLGTLPTCGPCQTMKAELRGLQEEGRCDNYVGVILQANSEEFQTLTRHFQIVVETVPATILVSPDGQLLHWHSGGMSANQLSDLLSSTSRQLGPRLSGEQRDHINAIHQQVKRSAAAGELVDALQLVTPAAKLPIQDTVVARSQRYRDQLVTAIQSWLVRLDEDMASQKNRFSAAFHLANITRNVPREYAQIRSTAKAILKRYSNTPNSALAVRQASLLVLAREKESEERCRDALALYRELESLGPESPAGKLASRRIRAVRRRQGDKLTRIGGGTMRRSAAAR